MSARSGKERRRTRARASEAAEATARLTVDTSGVEQRVRETEDIVENSAVAMISTIRQAAQTGIFLAQATGFAINQIMALQIETALLTIELAATSLAALSVPGATIGALFTGKAALQLGAILSMLFLIVQIEQKKTQAAQQTQGIVSLLRMATFR